MSPDSDKSQDEESETSRLTQCFSESGEAPKDISQNDQNEAILMAIPCFLLFYFLPEKNDLSLVCQHSVVSQADNINNFIKDDFQKLTQQQRDEDMK